MIDNEYIKEVKISSKMKKADEMQLYYYLYYLKQLGIIRKGKIHYVKEKKIEEIDLNLEIEQEIENAIEEIQQITNHSSPPPLYKLPYCKKCAYYELCFSKEEG
ncbi:MAG: CRISPR-associated exonuclease Cas4 [Clostridiales bacterium]|nr:CRISPR-associated exonuclease Cas4 [Clostridiales bacterium]